MPLPLTTLLSHANDRNGNRSHKTAAKLTFFDSKIVLSPSLLFFSNLEATEQASQPVNEQTILALTHIVGGWQERPLSSSSLVSHSEFVELAIRIPTN